MRTVNIAELKARLSAHIQHVREGEEVLVCERNRPVARIIPCREEDHTEQERELIARGTLTPPLKRRSNAAWPQPPGNIPDEVISRLWHEEREGR
jgi:prevent-host-death family protein